MSFYEDSRNPDKARKAISALVLVEALEGHVLGTFKMTASQVSAALALLKKVMPDLPSSSLNKKEPDKEPVKIIHEEALEKLDAEE